MADKIKRPPVDHLFKRVEIQGARLIRVNPPAFQRGGPGHNIDPSGEMEPPSNDVKVKGYPEPLDNVEPSIHWFTLVSAVIARELDRWQEITGKTIGPDDMEPANWVMAEIGRSLPARDYLAAKEAIATFSRSTARWWAEGFDLLLSPTIGMLPARIGEFDSPADAPLEGFMRTAPIGAYTVPFNLTGQPAISLPLHWTADGIPAGVQFAASYGREDLLIRVASQLEKARPWKDKWPLL